uniref:non-specific protein-tyrosine kinase n=2 Tax=Fervidobacterium pennivorans TaxID=93466 RepID=A0A7C4VW26_FERPE
MDGEIRQDELTLEDILRIFKKHIWWFVATLIGIVALTVAYLIVATPIYEASVTINIEPRTKSTLTDLFSATGYIGSKPDIATEVELIKSRTNIEKVVENLNLLSYFREKMNIKNGELTTYDVVNMIAKMITVTTVKDTSIVKVSVQNPDPELAKNLANELANVYNEMLQKFSKNEYTARRMFIESQIPKVEQELKQVEDELKRFKEKNKIYVLDVEAQNLLNTVYQLDTQINNYKIQIEETKARIAAITEQLKRTNQKVVSSETISINPVVAQLRAKLADLQIQLAGLLNTYSENDERVKTVRNQIDETERMLKSQIEKVITSQVETINPNYSELYNQLIQANTTLQMLNSSIAAVERMRDSYSSKIAQLPAVEQQLLQLERDRKVKETLYSVLLEKLEETKISEAGVIGRATIIDPAITPTVPVKPNKKLTLAVGGVLGIFLGILMVFLREAFDKTISDEGYVKQVLKDAPVLGRIPEVEFPESSERPELVVINLPTSPQAEALKLTATNIEYSTTPAPKIIAITSSGPGEGKTFIAANIALSYAQNGVKTLLLDFDMRKPRIEKVLGIERINVGVSNHILKDVPLDRIITKYQENLDIIPVGPIPPNPTVLLASKKLEELVATLRTMYDRIVIDLPPILAAADALIVSKLVDGLVLVIRAGKTQKSSLKVAFENIVTSSSKLLGSVINAINANQRGYYYYYYYYYTEEGKKMKRKKRHKK